MGDNIQQFGGGHRNLLEQQAKLVRMKLRSGPVLLGEHHDRPGARAVAADLILEGAVTQLFLEIGSLVGMPDDMLDAILTMLDARHANPFTLRDLMTVAAFNHVGVIGYDEPTTSRGRLAPASQGGMRDRNVDMGNAMRTHGGVGSLAIVGAAHLFPGPSGGTWGRTLQVRGALGLGSAIDLSRYA